MDALITFLTGAIAGGILWGGTVLLSKKPHHVSEQTEGTTNDNEYEEYED